MERFKIGQRWISEMEPELGLGIVTQIEVQSVRIHFPASDCERLYAVASAPIKRVQFKQGDTVRSREGQSVTVTATKITNGIITYLGGNHELPENELCDSISFTTPLERLVSGFIDDNRDFNLRYRALNFQHEIRKSRIHGFIGGRIELIPHQLYVAHEIASRPIPRVLLSDEVGLGKTIEACLILHRLLTCGRINRALILVPHSLVHQWFIELLRRFNLIFRIFDENYCKSITSANPDINPFLDDQLIICSVDFLASHDKWQQQATTAGWDMLVVDEAHHLTENSTGYNLVKQLSVLTKGLMLLTATPEQLGHRSHFARLHLLDPARYYDFDLFEQEEEQYQKVAGVVNKLVDNRKLTQKDVNILAIMLPDNFTDSKKEFAVSLQNDEKVRQQFINDLLDRHGMGRAVFRNTRAAITGFPKRVSHLIPLEATEEALKHLTLEFTAESGTNEERITCDYKGDPRIVWLVQFIKKHKDKKVLLLCHSIEKVQAIEDALRKQMKVNMVLFHENLTLLQRDRNAAWFANKDGSQLLICSEIGSEGRNFQFSHHLVLFDLPLDPELLEQRIGRLDRIGQKKTIQIYVPFLKGSEYEILARWYHEGLNAFEQNVPGVYQIFQDLGAQVRKLAEERLLSHLDAFLKSTRLKCSEMALKLERGRDRLLELNSFQPETAKHLIHEITVIDREKTIDKFMLRMLQLNGISVKEVSDRTHQLKLDLLSEPEFPLPVLRPDGLIVTFDRNTALSHEDVEFISWDHPMVIGAMDLMLGSEKGNCTFSVWPDSDSQEMLLEVIFVVECVAPKNLHVDRFLPPAPIRIVVNHLLHDCSAAYATEQFTRCLKNSREISILDNPQVKQELLPEMVKKCNEIAENRVPEIINTVLEVMQSTLKNEVRRLIELSNVNPNIRKDEIEHCEQEIELIHTAISTARLRLDALRFILKGQF